MTLSITSQSGSIGSGISRILGRIVSLLESSSGRIMTESMTKDVKEHVANRYPGSQHYNPNKVQPGRYIGTYGETKIDIPGISRAYHNVTILPKRASALTIPMHSMAYGKKATDFNNLFVPQGKNYLAMLQGGKLIAMFRLATKAFQQLDRSLMPTDDKLSDNIFKSLTNNLKI